MISIYPATAFSHYPTVYSFSLANSTATNEILTVTATGTTTIYYTGSQDNNLSTNNGGLTNFATDRTGATNTGALPSATSAVFFTADAANNLNTVLGGDLTYSSLTFTGTGTAAAGGVTIGGPNTLTVNAGSGFGINVQAGSGANTISANLALGSSQLWTNNATNPFTVSGNVSGAFGLTTNGTGTFALSGAGNTYSGGTTVNQGTLTGNTSGAFGTGSVTVNPTTATSSASDNATLSTNGSIAPTAVVTVNSEANDGGFGIGTINFNGATPTIGSLAGSGNVVLNSAGGTTLTTGGLNTATTFSGVISDGAGPGSLTKTGTAAFTLSGANTYTGATTISGGTITATSLANGGTASSIGQSSNAAGSLVLDGGALNYTGAAVSTDRLFTLTANGGTVNSSGTGPLTFSNVGTIATSGTGARTLTLGTGGTSRGGIFNPVITDGAGGATSVSLAGNLGWILNGTNTYTGNTLVNLTVGIGNSTALGTGTLTNATGGNLFLAATGGDQTIANNFNFTGNRLVIEDGGQNQFATGTTFGNLTIGGNVAFNGAAGGPDDLFLRKNLTLTGVVSGNNNGKGAFNFTNNAGTLTLTNAANTFAGINFGVASTLNVNSDGALGTAANTLAFNAGSNGATLQAGASFSTARGISVVTAVTANIDTQANTLTETGVISGAGAIKKIGTGTLIFTGANTYTSGTTITSGTLSGTTTPTASSFGTGAIADNATLDLGGSTGKLANTVSGTGALTVDGNAANPTATGAVITMTGTNTYTGGTTVNAPSGGTTTLSGNAGSYGSGNITVNSGATVDYTQSATTGTATNNISGAGNVTFGGNTSPGTNGTGGTVNYTGQDSAATTVQSGTVVLNNASGPALSGPVAIATSGTVQLGSSNQIQTSAQGTPSNVALNGGTLNANGNSDGSISGTPSSDPTTSAVTSSMGTLSLGSGTASLLDFGLGSTNSIVAFADSLTSLSTGNGTLNVIDYTGGTDALYIGNSATLTTDELSRITFGGMSGTTQLANGQLAAAPEPSAWASLGVGLLGLGGLVVRAKKRRGAMQQEIAQAA